MSSSSNIKQFNEKYKIRHFNILQSTFWDSKEKIKQNYDNLNKIVEENNEKPKEKQKNFLITAESLKQSYNFLINEEERQNYLSFLKYYYFVSVCIPGILAYRSIVEGGRTLDVPDLRRPEERDRVRHDTFCTFEESAGDMYVSPTAAQWKQPVIDDRVYEEVRRKWLAGEPG